MHKEEIVKLRAQVLERLKQLQAYLEKLNGLLGYGFESLMAQERISLEDVAKLGLNWEAFREFEGGIREDCTETMVWIGDHGKYTSPYKEDMGKFAHYLNALSDVDRRALCLAAVQSLETRPALPTDFANLDNYVYYAPEMLSWAFLMTHDAYTQDFSFDDSTFDYIIATYAHQYGLIQDSDVVQSNPEKLKALTQDLSAFLNNFPPLNLNDWAFLIEQNLDIEFRNLEQSHPRRT